MSRKIVLITKKDNLAKSPTFSGAAMPYYDPFAGIWRLPINPMGKTNDNRAKAPDYANFYEGVSRKVSMTIIWVDMPDDPPTLDELHSDSVQVSLSQYNYPLYEESDKLNVYLADAPFWVMLSPNELSAVELS